MTAQTKEESQPKEDPAMASDKRLKQEAVCCFCPIRPCPLILLILITPIFALGMYSAFYDPHYVYVIVAYGIPSTSGNNTDAQNKTSLPTADASTQTEGEKIFYLPFENHFPQTSEEKSGENLSDPDQQNDTLQSKISLFLVDFPYYYRLIFYGDSDEEKSSEKNVEGIQKVVNNRLKEQKIKEDTSPVVLKLMGNEAKTESDKNVVPVSESDSSKNVVPPVSESTALAIIDPYQERYFRYEDEFFNIPNPNLCENFGENVTIIIGIHSFCVDFERRKAIRESWAQLADNQFYKYVFFLGFPMSNDVMNRVMHESHKHHDIIQTSFIEGANTESAQSVMFLKWVSRECPRTQWVMKTEDDVFVNLPYALYSMDEQDPSKRAIYGFVDEVEEGAELHNHHGTHHTTANTTPTISASNPSTTALKTASTSADPSPEDKKQKYPSFVGGAGYILPGFLSQELYHSASSVPTIQHESLFVTGILAEKLNISRVDIPWFDASSVTDIPRDDPCSIMSVSFIIHPFSADDMTSFWAMLRQKSFNCGNFKYFAAKMKSNYTSLMYSSSLDNPKLNAAQTFSGTAHQGNKVGL